MDYSIVMKKTGQAEREFIKMDTAIQTSGIQEEADPNTEVPNFKWNPMNDNPLNTICKNPLLINTVIQNVLEFLPLNQLKKCRLVNHQWNTTAGPLLRKRGVIHFKYPTGAKLSSIVNELELPFPDLPFTAFRFSSDGVKSWNISIVREFFEGCGPNIKSLEFRNMFLTKKNLNFNLDVTSWIAKADNLTKLIIDIDPAHRTTGMYVDLDILRNIESITLNRCKVNISCASEKSLRVSPIEITLDTVRFRLKQQSFNNQICLNDYIDFSRCFKIDIRNNLTGVKFDMSSDVLNANSVYLERLSVKNWGGANGKVDSIFLYDVRLVERNNLEIKELTLQSGTIDMSIIPPTIEKLRFSDNAEIICDYSLQLMNLQFLCLDKIFQRNLDVISRFACCTNLKQVELIGYTLGSVLTLKIGNIPKSVKKLKIRNVRLIPDGHERQLNTLIIEESNFKDFFNSFTQIVRNTNLEMNLLVISCLNVIDLKTSDIIRFVNENMGTNKNFEKLVIGAVGDVVFLNINEGFKGSVLSRNVDKESNYYQFTNTVGKAITAEQFSAYRNFDGH